VKLFLNGVKLFLVVMKLPIAILKIFYLGLWYCLLLWKS
jgi:hypothetical protein